ncbi:hypothetical protein ABT294_24635 [Nonomuraea sp. NPDC000554]|uniref:protein kinase family protein n=1 Tax=Nonomuraea sp. NPDC000554 TaxID=3154259 RepID=UPI00331C8298
MTDRLGSYWLGTRLGGDGQVIEAYDESGTRHALWPLRLPDTPEARARFADGAKAAQLVRSLSVATVVDADLTGERPFLVSEYVPGPSLSRVVSRHGPLAGDDLYRLAAATATALAAIHEAGAVHGALTPDRVILGADGPRVTGLGVARPDGGPPADVRSWGLVLLFAAHGREPVQTGRLDRLLRTLVASALHPDPAHRPSARQLLLSLLDAPQSQQGRLLPPEPVDDPPLGARAEARYLQLSRADQNLVPEVFLRLVGLGSDGSDTREPATRDDLVAGRTPEQAAAIDRVLEAFGEAGLLTRDGAVTIAQAALLRAWPRLHDWLDAERDGLAVHRELARAARRWEAAGRRDTDLFQDDPLDRTLAWAASGRRHLTLGAGEQAFLDAGLALARGRARRRRTATAGLVSAVLVAALVAVVAAVWQSGAADERVDRAMAKVAASRAEALRTADPVLARRLALAAWRLSPVPEARRALADTADDPAVDVFTDPYAGDRSVHALSDDGTRLASLTDGTLRVFDVVRRRQLAQTPGPAQSVRAMAWAPDGRTLALVGVDRSYLWDTASGAGVGPPFGRGLGAPGQQSAWFSPGGGLLFAAARQSDERWAWDLRARRAAFAGEYAVVGPGDRVALVFAGTHSQARSGGTSTRRPWLDRMPWEYTTFSPDGRRVAIAEETGVQIYDLDGVPTLPSRLRPSPGNLRFSPDGRLLSSTDSDRVRVWRVPDGTLLADRQVPSAGVDRPVRAALGPDGRWVRVLAGRGTVLTIDLAHADAPADPATSLCGRYGGLSRAEWSGHLPEIPYRDLC